MLVILQKNGNIFKIPGNYKIMIATTINQIYPVSYQNKNQPSTTGNACP